MAYRKAEEVLPQEIIQLIQQYVDGESIYIPRKPENRQEWGSSTQVRQELQNRNNAIYEAYRTGSKVADLAAQFCLSEKSIWRIVRTQK